MRDIIAAGLEELGQSQRVPPEAPRNRPVADAVFAAVPWSLPSRLRRQPPLVRGGSQLTMWRAYKAETKGR